MGREQLSEMELRFASLVWEREPLGSGELVKLCAERFGWKKSTTYTVLKKLCQRGILENTGAVVSSLVSREQYNQRQSHRFVENAFGGSLPGFLTAFIGGRKLTKGEAEELRALIDRYEGE